MVVRLFLIVLTFWFAALTKTQAQTASGPVTTGHAVTELVSQKTAIAPGETIKLALAQQLQEHWHVYWQNPGDSGLPLTLDWTLPAGFTTGDIEYPTPHRITIEPLVNFGHQGEPAFLVDLTAPTNAIPGTQVTITVLATWLICDDICVPEEANLSITLPIASEPAGEDMRGGYLVRKALTELPVPAPYDFSWFVTENHQGQQSPALLLPQAETFKDHRAIEFFPYQPGLIEPAGEVHRLMTAAGPAILYKAAYEFDPNTNMPLEGVIALTTTDGRKGYKISATKIEAPAILPNTTERSAQTSPHLPVAQNFVTILLFSLLGGLILNVMPCVFPIVFLKATHLAQSAHENRATMIRHALLYTAGILTAFLSLAGLLLVLRAGGAQLGWGFHLQSPIVVAGFAFVIFAVGLNLAGLFEIGTSLQGVGQGYAARAGNSGAFFTGLLAVAVAAPCVGPLLGIPLGVALSQTTPIALLIFTMIGLGLALPYLLISIIPGLAHILPRPGPWMEIFKQLMSFALFATVIWLLWTVTLQTGSDGLVRVLIGLLLIGFAAWIFGKTQNTGPRLIGILLAGISIFLAGLAIHDLKPSMHQTTRYTNTELETVAYSAERLQQLRSQNIPVFIDFTAAWCITCQVNKTTVLNRPKVEKLFTDKGVVLMVADWTNRDPDITKALQAQGRSGVPLYLFYAPGAEKPVILPQMLSIKIIENTFSEL
ncbi:MAG: protein-disulfide reductase DsbD family protein [bacterium]